METSFIAQNFVPLMFAALFVFLLSGIPVAFGLAATGLFMGFIGMEAGLFGANLFQALPLRVFGIMQNDTLLAIPFFTLMGIILERSGMAEDLLETVGQVFGPVRGGLAIAVILVGALLAATTGVVAAAVISMGLISLPIMLRYGYNRTLATGTITASGTLAQAIPPSLVLIVLADQLGRSVGDMYAGALLPGLMLVGLYLRVRRHRGLRQAQVGAGAAARSAHLPRSQRRQRPPSRCWCCSRICAVAGVAWSKVHESIINPLIERSLPAPGDEIFILSMTVASVLALALALVNRIFKIGLLSRLTEQVTFVLIPPLVLIFLVLGTIFLGIATPTEGGAMGALGALLMALGRGKLSKTLLVQALDNTTSCRASCCSSWSARRCSASPSTPPTATSGSSTCSTDMPGGAMGFLIVVNILVFVLGMFIDFFEIAFIVIPILAPVAGKILPDLLPEGTPPEMATDLVRRDHRDEPADLVPDATLRFCAVLSAQRGGQDRLRRRDHRRAHRRR